MPNAYVSLAEFKATAIGMGLNISGTGGDSALLALIESVSRQVDRHCGRVFFTTSGTRVLSGDGSTCLLTPDIVSISTLEEDALQAGTFSTAWATSDYYLGPEGRQPTVEWGAPYSWLEVNRSSNGSRSAFTKGQRNFRLTGTFGYISAPLTVATLSAALTATATSLDFGTSAVPGSIPVGVTVVAESEQMYVTGATGTSLTVRRAMNLTTGTAHGSAVALSRHQYPEAVRLAVQIQAGRILKRAQVGYASNSGNPETQSFAEVGRGMDADVRDLLGPYRVVTFGRTA